MESGYRYVVPSSAGNFDIVPYAALQAQQFHTPTYNETDLTGGGLGLTFNAMDATDTRSELGSRFAEHTVINGMPLILRAACLGARLGQQSRSQRGIPIAAGIELRR